MIEIMAYSLVTVVGIVMFYYMVLATPIPHVDDD
jgi:hypothetical protein